VLHNSGMRATEKPSGVDGNMNIIRPKSTYRGVLFVIVLRYVGCPKDGLAATAIQSPKSQYAEFPDNLKTRVIEFSLEKEHAFNQRLVTMSALTDEINR